MKISEQIRRASDAPSPGLLDEGEELEVDTEEKPEEATVVPDKEIADLTHGGKVLADTGFFTKSERRLMHRRGWTLVPAGGYLDDALLEKEKARDLDNLVNVFVKKLKFEAADLMRTVKDKKKVRGILQKRYDFVNDALLKKLGL